MKCVYCLNSSKSSRQRLSNHLNQLTDSPVIAKDQVWCEYPSVQVANEQWVLRISCVNSVRIFLSCWYSQDNLNDLNINDRWCARVTGIICLGNSTTPHVLFLTVEVPIAEREAGIYSEAHQVSLILAICRQLSQLSQSCHGSCASSKGSKWSG